MFRKIYIQLICITKTRNGKLVALGWKQPLQEKLDIFSVWWKGSLYQTECLVKWDRLWYSLKSDCHTFWRLFSMIKMCCFVIFTDLSFVNNYFNVFQNIGFHWSTLSLITTMNQEIFQTYTWFVSFHNFIKR